MSADIIILPVVRVEQAETDAKLKLLNRVVDVPLRLTEVQWERLSKLRDELDLTIEEAAVVAIQQYLDAEDQA